MKPDLEAPESAPAATTRRWDRWAVAVIVLGAVLRLAMLAKPVVDGDIDRFEAEARSILRGEGYALRSEDAIRYVGIPRSGLVTEHPPGYPVVIAVLYSVWDDRRMLLISNWLMSTAAIFFLYRAVRPVSPPAGLFAATLLALNPWIIRWTSYLMSETLALFFTSLLVWQMSKIERGQMGWPRALAMGVLCVAQLLTVPATIFFDALVVLATAWYARRQWASLAALAVGCLLVMVPWQIHCVVATGRIQPGILTHGEKMLMRSNFVVWVNTWMDSTDQIHVFWNPDYFDEIPDHVFANDAERQALKHAATAWRLRGDDFAELENTFGQAAERRKAELGVFGHQVVLPFWRGVTLWTQHQRLLWRHGWQLAVVDAVCNAINWSYLALFVLLAVVGVRSRQPYALAIVGGVLLYTVYNGYVGLEEYRRNYPFYPALLFLVSYAYWPATTAEQAGSVGS